MSTAKNKSIQGIEEKMGEMDVNSMRYKVLECTKRFKTSWIELGQILYTVYKDKLYKDWGYIKFDTYVSKEIGIRNQTALKLLRSYRFLEKEEPQLLQIENQEEAKAAAIPSYESVDVLRRAHNNKEIDNMDYARIKKDIFEKGKDVKDVRKDLTQLMRERRELDPQEAWKERRSKLLRRFLSQIRSIRNEIRSSKMLSPGVIKEADKLISMLEEELG